jgi:hypothetical protein
MLDEAKVLLYFSISVSGNLKIKVMGFLLVTSALACLYPADNFTFC